MIGLLGEGTVNARTTDRSSFHRALRQVGPHARDGWLTCEYTFATRQDPGGHRRGWRAELATAFTPDVAGESAFETRTRRFA